MKILALDLGKFNSVSCLYNTKTQATEFWICATNRPYLRTNARHVFNCSDLLGGVEIAAFFTATRLHT